MVGNIEVIMSQLIAKCKGLVVQKNSATAEIEQQDVLYVPDLWTNLLYVTKAIDNPKVKLSSSHGIISLNLGQDNIHFDKELENGSGRLLGVDILPHSGDIPSITKYTPLDINTLNWGIQILLPYFQEIWLSS
jgi:hypothetical protein